MKTKHAVLCPGNKLMWIEGTGFHKEVLPEPCRTLYELAEIGYKRFITHLWVMPEYGKFEAVGNNAEWGISPYKNENEDIMGATVFKRGHRNKDLTILFPQNTKWWGPDSEPGWMRECDPQEILITLHYLEKALGIPVGGSPGSTGWNYLKKIHPEWIETIGVDLVSCHLGNEATSDIIWPTNMRPLSEDQKQKKYIHKFDKSAAYPYAASTTALGVGIPVHVDHGNDALIDNDKQPIGSWRCTIEYGPYNQDMPPVWMEHLAQHKKAREGWLAGPIIRLLRSQGHKVHPHEGYVFPEKHEIMAKWATNLWCIRQGFDSPAWKNRKCAQLAKSGTKQIMNMTIGITAFGGFIGDNEMKRPDIRTQVIAKHRELTWHNIEAVRKVHGIAPILVYMDAAYYLSDDPNGRSFLPELVKREFEKNTNIKKFGGWKWEGRVEMTPDVLDMFATDMAPANRLSYLNGKGWIQ